MRQQATCPLRCCLLSLPKVFCHENNTSETHISQGLQAAVLLAVDVKEMPREMPQEYQRSRSMLYCGLLMSKDRQGNVKGSGR